MLFNSFTFLAGFLPVVMLGYHLLASAGDRRLALCWLVLASLVFYGWWYPPHLLLIGGSMALNLLIGMRLMGTPSMPLLVAGIGANLALIALFKYADFGLSVLRSMGMGDVPELSIALPLAISFFTFQQIAFLVDASRGEVADRNPLRYALFVSFFPQLIAGPIVRHREIAGQLRDRIGSPLTLENLALGAALIVIGLGKKVLIADPLAACSDPVFADALAGRDPSLVEAWAGTLAFTFQLYFDFSAYSDMAVGLARLFGIGLPQNFDAPYRATSIIAFWRRWHMTLSSFLRDYLYIPLGGSHRGPSRQTMAIMVTMLLGGLWHGAGWTFLVWGGLHGIFLLVNHAWHRRTGTHRPSLLSDFAGLALTFLCVHLAWVLFRAESFASAWAIWMGLVGMNGVLLPEYYLDMLGGLGATLHSMGVSFEPSPDFRFAGAEQVALTMLAAGLVFIAPTSWRLVGLVGEIRFVPRLGPATSGAIAGVVLGMSLLAMHSDPPDAFVYFQF